MMIESKNESKILQKYIRKKAQLQYRLGNNATGGDTTANTWINYPLNHIQRNDFNIVKTFSGGAFTLEPGRYKIDSEIIIYGVGYTGLFKSRLRLNDASTILVGMNTSGGGRAGDTLTSNTCYISGIVEISVESSFRLQIVATHTLAGGLGRPSNFGEQEIYGQIEIEKLEE